MNIKELPLDYPIHYDYLYWVSNKEEKIALIRSDIKGTVFDLITDLRNQGLEANNIYKYEN